MFESLLESVLNKYLGEYVEGLSPKALSVSIWGGDIKLDNVMLKKDIFAKFKLPLELVFGRIGTLRIQVPWRHLGSQPVIVEIENIWLVVQPKTDSSKWESVETLETSFSKKEELVREMAKNLFEDMMKSAEEKQKDAGMTASLVTKIIDNLQISLKNLHVRVENEDTTEPDLSFSMGLTLQAIDLCTTDENWQKNFVDRTKEVNKKKAMYKILEIINFGVYYKTKETSLISQARTDEEKAVVLDSYSHYDSDGRIMKQADDYLVTPLTLKVQLTQNEPQVALQKGITLMNLYVGLNMFGITIQKCQYDNVQMLLELTSEYIRFLSQESLRARKDNLHKMNLLLEQNGLQISKKEIKKLYKEIFDTQMDVTLAADPKKTEKLFKSLEQSLIQSGKLELYRAIVLGTNSDTLVLWAKEVIAQKANTAKREAAIKNHKKGKGFFARAFGAKEQTEEEKAEQLDQIAKELDERAASISAMIGNKEARQNIPDITFEFALEKVELTLVNDLQNHKGVTLCAEKLSVIFKTFDGTNKYNKRTMNMEIGLQNYGLWVVFKKPDQEIDYSPFLQKLLKIEDREKALPGEDGDEEFFDCHDLEQKQHIKPQQMTYIYLSFGNKEHHESDLPKEAIDETDLELDMKMQPIEIIYRAETVFEIVRFFKVKKLKSVTKLAALQKFQQLTNQVEAMTGNLDKDFKNNKITIRVAAPTLVIPFDKKVHDNSECWVFTMGDVSLNSLLGVGQGFNEQTHEAFELKVERVKFEHTTNYLQWKEKISSQIPLNQRSSSKIDSLSPLQIDSDSAGSALLPRKYTIQTQKIKPKTKKAFRMTKILEDFSSTVLLLKKRSEDEMSTPEMMQALQSDKSPAIQIKAQFDDEMKFSLQPQVFHDLVKIGSLFTEGEKPEEYYKQKMLKKLQKAKYHGNVRLVTQYRFQSGTAAILAPSSLYFWPENHADNFQIFDLNGCENEQSGGISSGGLNMVLVNSSKKRFEISFVNHVQTQHWLIAMFDVLKELRDMKKQGLGIPTDLSATSEKIPTEASEEQKAEEPLPADAISQGNADFGLKFKVPKISLTLKTPRKTYSRKTASGQAVNWVLNTYLSNIDLEMNQRKEGLTILLHVSQLTMTDNGKDERFPFIFQNLPVQGQTDLVTFELKYVDKTSPEFTDCETFINLGFSGLQAYWKPETMINFLDFFINNNSLATKQSNQQKQTNKKLDDDLKNEINQEVDLSGGQIDDQAVQIVQKYKGCLDKPAFVVKINVKLAYLQAIFIHPDNNTYPIFTIKVQETGVDYWKKCDHDQIILRVKNIQVFDNTKYPETFSPQEQYQADDEIYYEEIIGLNTTREVMDQNMLNFTCLLFDYPIETRCEHQCKNEQGEPCKDYNILLKMDLQQMKLIFMMEQTLRIVDYSLNWIIKLDRDRIDSDLQEESLRNGKEEEEKESEIFEEETEKNLSKDDIQSEMSSFESVNVETLAGDDVDWANFDLKQELHCPKLDLNLSCPLIIMPNLSEPNERFELDFGTIKITSNLVEEKQRWVNYPEKLSRSMAVTVQNHNLRFDFKKEGLKKQYQPILKEDTVDVNITVPNVSPYFEQKNEKGVDIKPPVPIDKEGHLFDMNQVDTSVAVLIKQSLLKLHLKQDVIIELFKCLEHNIMKKDKFSEEFSRALMWRKATLKMQSSLSTKRAQKSIQQKKIKQFMVSEKFSDDSDEGAQQKQKLKKKTLQVTVQASCLSIELRKVNDELISEFCMVNFELGQQVFADGIQRIYMKAYSFFIFHDEDPITYTKQVMFGHINANNSMVTTDDFYHTLPEKFWKKQSQTVKPKQQLDFELIIDENTKTTQMNIQLAQLKFFLRPQVFNEISEFTIECLKKLDLKKNKDLTVQNDEEDDPLNDSFFNPAKGTADDRGSTQKIVFKLFESILVLERREFQKKAAVVQLGVEMKLTQHDQRAIERQIAGQKIRHTGTQKSRYRPIQDIELKILQLTPYIINIKDLESTMFSKAKKRVLISAFDLDLSMTSKISQADTSQQVRKMTELLDPHRRTAVKKPVMKFKNKNSLEVKMTPIQAQVSMDDLYVMQQLGNKVSEEALVVSKMWQDYQESSIVTESDKQRKIQQDVPPENTIEFSLDQGADIVIINEDKGNFVPMFLFSCESVIFFQNSGLEQQDKSDGNADTMCSLYYFNALKGYWEPAIERFSVSVKLEQRGKNSGQTVMLKDHININVSVYLGSVINDFLKLWEKSAKRAKVFQKRMAMGNENALAVSYSVKSRDSLIIDQNVMLMDTEEALADFVTPYAIRNLTDRPFSVISLKQGSDILDNISKIEKGEIKGLAVSFSDTLNMSELDHNGRKTVVSKDQFVRIKFERSFMKAISKFKLNQNSNYVKHKVFDDSPRDSKIKNPNINREFYVVQNQLEDQRRVLTVRTQHVLINKTQTTYNVKQFWVEKILADGKQKKVVWIFFEDDLLPGGSMPLPDHEDEDIVEKLKICLRPKEGSKKWSEEFKVSALKSKLKCDLNIMWSHYKTYSILRKEKTGMEGVFNYMLLPAMIIKNCLPLPLLITLSQEYKTEEQRKTNMRAADVQSKQQQDSPLEGLAQNRMQIGEYEFQRGQEMVFNTISNQAASIDLLLKLDSQHFQGQILRLHQAKEAKDTEEVIRFRDRENRTFKIYVRIDTQNAGNKVVIYAKNVLLCHTEQSIEFFYQKKTDVFKEDNANEFPFPVKDNRNKKVSHESTMITDRNEGNEPTIYIHEEHSSMCAALTGSESVKSELVPINTPGSTGKFSIACGNMLYMFQCSTATYQPSEKEAVFTRMVEVSPQYIVCNLSSQDIFFCQAHFGMDQTDFLMILRPKDRQPFHWADKGMPQTAKFFVYGAVRETAHFSLADCGSLAVTNITQDGARHFFRITKRMVLNSNFIIIEDMNNAPYKIDNLCSDLNLSYFQAGARTLQDIETCPPKQHRPFAWREILDSQFMLNVQFFRTSDDEVLIPVKPQDPKRPRNLEFSLDILNRTYPMRLMDQDRNERTVYVSVYTDQFSKVFEISDVPSVHIFEAMKDRKKRQNDQIEELKWNESVDISSSVALTTLDGDDDAVQEEMSKTRLDIRQINISLINQKQREVLTVVLDRWVSMIGQRQDEWIYEATLSRLQIDNQGQMMPLFPVILKPKCTNVKAPHNHKTMEGVEPTFQLYISIKTNIPNVQYINLFEFLLKELELKIEIEHLMSIFEFAQAFNERFNAGLASSHRIFADTCLPTDNANNQLAKSRRLMQTARQNQAEEIQQIKTSKRPAKSVRFKAAPNNLLEESKDIMNSTLAIEEFLAAETGEKDENQDDLDEQNNQLTTWRSNLITDTMEIVYIEKYKGSPLMIEVSIFKQTRTQEQTKEERKSGGIGDLLGNLGLQFANISGAPIQLNALEIENVYGTQSVVKGLLSEHYNSNLKTNILKLVGSTDIIGNPTDFVKTLGTGAKQFYYAPKEGFMQGPLQGGLGIIKGTGSLVAHTFGGIAGSISKITGTLNRGVLALSMDNQYRQAKEIKDIQQKPKGGLDGMAKGAKGLGSSIWSGLHGIVSQPYKGAKAEGLKGFGKGIGKGLIGTVVKPVSGVVDFVSKTTEGFESAVDGGVCQQNDKKMRKPRPFYKEAGVFREFSKMHARLYSVLRNTQNPKYKVFSSQVDIFFGAFKLGTANPNEDVKDSDIMMLTNNFLVVVDPRLEVLMVIANKDMLVPSRATTNPILEGRTLKIFVSTQAQPKELEFMDEIRAKAAFLVFADMFYTRTDRLTTHLA